MQILPLTLLLSENDLVMKFPTFNQNIRAFFILDSGMLNRNLQIFSISLLAVVAAPIVHKLA